MFFFHSIGFLVFLWSVLLLNFFPWDVIMFDFLDISDSCLNLREGLLSFLHQIYLHDIF